MSPDRKKWDRRNPVEDFIKEYLLGNPKKAVSSEKMLLGILHSSPNIDPILETVFVLQQYMLTAKNPTTLKKAALLAGKILEETIYDNQDMRQAPAITPRTTEICESIERADLAMKGNSFLQSALPFAYRRLITMIPEVRKQSREGLSQLELPLTSLEWICRAEEYFLLPDKERNSPLQQDKLVNLVKTAVKPSIFGCAKLIDKTFDGLSLADIEKMSYPLSKNDHFRATKFLIDVFSQELDLRETAIISQLFKQQIYFSSAAEGRILYRNKALLANLNNWQEQLMDRLLFSQGESSDSQIKVLIQIAPESFTQFLPFTMARWTCNAAEMDPNFSSKETQGDCRGIIENHPLVKAATNSYRSSPMVLYVGYLDKLGRKYLLEKSLPLLKARLKQFGLLEKCQDGIEAVRADLKNYSFARQQLDGFFRH